MTQVDFLPESYHRSRQRRGRLMRQIALVAGMAVCLFAATVAIKAHSMNQAQTAERLEDTVRSERNTMDVITGINHERKQLLKTFDLKRELEPPVTYTQVLALLTQALPEGVAVTELSMVSVRPKPEPVESKRPTGRKAKIDSTKEEMSVEPDLITVELQGLAPDDLSVAVLVSTLDEHPIFGRVTMRSSEGVNVQGLMAREFTLTATVDLDREFRWVNDIAKEVASAD